MWSMTTIFVIEPSARPCSALAKNLGCFRDINETMIVLHDGVCVKAEGIKKLAVALFELREPFGPEEEWAGIMSVAAE